MATRKKATKTSAPKKTGDGTVIDVTTTDGLRIYISKAA